MTVILLLAGTFVIFAAMLYLTLAVNDFEKKTRELATLLERRYTLPVPQKKDMMSGMSGITPGQTPAKQ